jgi:hypothetical protein
LPEGEEFADFPEADLQEYKKALEQADKITASLKDAKSINKRLVISKFSAYKKQVEAIKASYTAIINTKILSKTATAAANSSKDD